MEDFMSEYLVCIDPGHGGRQVGAVSKEFGYQEKVIALDISLKVRDLLLYSDLEGSKLVFREYCQTESRPERIRIKQSGKRARI